jgi:DNA-binding response OmpR family regulator
MLSQRKKRVIIFDDEIAILTMLEKHFIQRGYEVLTFEEPVVCPVYENSSDNCENIYPCADLMFVDFKMPKMNGVELLEHQKQRGCKLHANNKAIITGFVIDEYLDRINKLGSALIRKPFAFSGISSWLRACEERMDLSHRLGIKRRELRYTTDIQVLFHIDKQDEILEGDIINLSKYGMCLKVYKSLHQGQVITINTELPTSCQSAYVQWIKKMESDYFIAGLSCCEIFNST